MVRVIPLLRLRICVCLIDRASFVTTFHVTLIVHNNVVDLHVCSVMIILLLTAAIILFGVYFLSLVILYSCLE